MNNEQEIVCELIKEWFVANNAAYLAKENQICFWGKLRSAVDDDEWVIWSMREAANIFKATIIPFGLMKECTADVIMLAALELGRSFVSGVHSDVEVLPQYFNYNREALRVEVKDIDFSLELMTRIVRNFERATINVLIKDVGMVFNKCYTMLELAPMTRNKRNILLRRVLESKNCLYKEKNYSNRYTYEGQVHAIIKHQFAVGIQKLTKDMIESFALQALRGSIAAQRFAKGDQREILGVAV